ncbi:hypothetical protein AB6A40_009636 [Gnathostoma spinigerum]|uniref:Uncharacterized protein n=1 Tax=Gnathostoma spinigerum TaxID=75299 RepID=A0ABD6F167_9BILA
MSDDSESSDDSLLFPFSCSGRFNLSIFNTIHDESASSSSNAKLLKLGKNKVAVVQAELEGNATLQIVQAPLICRGCGFESAVDDNMIEHMIECDKVRDGLTVIEAKHDLHDYKVFSMIPRTVHKVFCEMKESVEIVYRRAIDKYYYVEANPASDVAFLLASGLYPSFERRSSDDQHFLVDVRDSDTPTDLFLSKMSNVDFKNRKTRQLGNRRSSGLEGRDFAVVLTPLEICCDPKISHYFQVALRRRQEFSVSIPLASIKKSSSLFPG